jgi:LacI family transcriptional regulator
LKVTIRDVARAAQVSVATVSRALNGSETVSPDTRNHVLKVASDMDFVPHAGARSLSLRRTDTIGVLLPDLHGEYFSELIRGLDIGARAAGQHLLLSASHGDLTEAVAALRTMRSRVDGLVVMSPFANSGAIGEAISGKIPLVMLGGSATGRVTECFQVDNHEGAMAVTRHLIESGHREIAFVAGPADNVDSNERLRGYRDAHAEAGLRPGPLVQGDFREEAGVEAAGLLMRSRLPSAIFAANDAMAIGCLRALRSAGLRVPEDVALAGFDDIPMARLIEPALTTAGVCIADMGREAIDRCVALVRGDSAAPACRPFAPKLIIRASSGAKQERAAPPSRPIREEVR